MESSGYATNLLPENAQLFGEMPNRGGKILICGGKLNFSQRFRYKRKRVYKEKLKLFKTFYYNQV